MNTSSDFLNFILSPQAVRDTTARMYDHTLNGHGAFHLHEERLSQVADFVLEVIRDNYPDLDIPYHSRWGHFTAGSDQRLPQFFEKISSLERREQTRCQFDLVITSVLLDAGAGSDWSYTDRQGLKTGRSEGLGVASFEMFLAGAFSTDPKVLCATGEKLVEITTQDIAAGFQVSDSNPLVGLEGRSALIQKLGATVQDNSIYFPGARPGGLVDYLSDRFGSALPAAELLQTVLLSLGPIWPGRLTYNGTNLGDVWRHQALHQRDDASTNEPTNDTASYIAFHKLSQWLTYSLIEPLERGGVTVTDLDGLTGLAEYRNGGLFIDQGVLELKDPQLAHQAHPPQSDLIIEWRALTVQLLDRLAPLVRERLGRSASELPLAKILEGGTWWAGRKAASAKRPDGRPPLQLDSDGTVF